MEEVKRFVQECLPTLTTEDIYLIMETFFYLGVESFEDLQFIEPEKDLSSVLKLVQARKLKMKIDARFSHQQQQENKNELEDDVEMTKCFEQKDQDTCRAPASKKLKTSLCKEIKKKTEEQLLKDIEHQENDYHDNKLERNFQILKSNNEDLKRKSEELTSEIHLKDEKISKLEKKLNKYKTKYRDSIDKLNEQSALHAHEDFVQIGPNVAIPKNESLLLRANSLSMYTGDLMEIIFGREKLGSHVLKGIKGNKKTDILDSNIVKDIECHVISKFGATKQDVRYAMRMKLNAAHKMKKNGNNFIKLEQIL